MPFIHVMITGDKASRDQKKQIVEGVTKIMVDVLHKDPLHTHVVISEVPADNWGADNQLYSDKFATSTNKPL